MQLILYIFVVNRDDFFYTDFLFFIIYMKDLRMRKKKVRCLNSVVKVWTIISKMGKQADEVVIQCNS